MISHGYYCLCIKCRKDPRNIQNDKEVNDDWDETARKIKEDMDRDLQAETAGEPSPMEPLAVPTR